MEEQQNPTPPPCSINSCADCHFNDVCTKVGCKWNDTVVPNGPIPWCTPIKFDNRDWNNKTRWSNKTRWIDKINWIYKTNWTTKINWIYKTNWTTKIILEKDDAQRKNSTNEEWSLINIVALSGTGLFGLCMMRGLFYVFWRYYLKDKFEDMILEMCCGDFGEYFLSCWECIGCINDWKGRLEERTDATEFTGLTEKQINTIKEARSYNQIRYDKAVQISWERTCAVAKRSKLADIALKRNIELQPPVVKEEQQCENTIVEILPGTPRKRHRRMEI